MASTTEFRTNFKIELDGEPYTIIECQHVKPGKGVAFVKTRIKSLKTGLVQEKTFRSGEKINTPDLEEKEMQYLYREGEQFCFMDTSTYEQDFLTRGHLGEAAKWLQENGNVTVLFHNGIPIGVDVPNFVKLRIVETEPGVRGDTAVGGSKPAKVETGAVVQVPLFVNEGEAIRIDTRTGTYVERAK
ncbi:MAG: elongation factor P [Nitrospinota bacterium]